MAGKGRGRLSRRSDDRWFLYLPKNLCEDTLFPFRDGESVKVIFKENQLIVSKFPEVAKCKFCDKTTAILEKVNSDGTAHYKCNSCGEEFDE